MLGSAHPASVLEERASIDPLEQGLIDQDPSKELTKFGILRSIPTTKPPKLGPHYTMVSQEQRPDHGAIHLNAGDRVGCRNVSCLFTNMPRLITNPCKVVVDEDVFPVPLWRVIDLMRDADVRVVFGDPVPPVPCFAMKRLVGEAV